MEIHKKNPLLFYGVVGIACAWFVHNHFFTLLIKISNHAFHMFYTDVAEVENPLLFTLWSGTECILGVALIAFFVHYFLCEKARDYLNFTAASLKTMHIGALDFFFIAGLSPFAMKILGVPLLAYNWWEGLNWDFLVHCLRQFFTSLLMVCTFWGFIMPLLLKTQVTPWFGIMVTAFVFYINEYCPISHKNIDAYSLGLLLGWLRYQHRSLRLPIALHLLYSLSCVHF